MWVLKAVKLHQYGIVMCFYVNCSFGLPTGLCQSTLEKLAHWSNSNYKINLNLSLLHVCFIV